MSHYFTNLRTPKNVTVVSSFTKMQLMTTLFLDKCNDDLAQYSSNHAYALRNETMNAVHTMFYAIAKTTLV